MIGESERQKLIAEIEDLRARLYEAEETIRAIREGEVDALVVSGPKGEQIFTLQGAEHAYRVLVEAMNEGALVLTPEGSIAYANRTFAALLNVPLERLVGASIFEFIANEHGETVKCLLEQACSTNGRAEVGLKRYGVIESIPAHVSIGSMEFDEADAFSAVVTDLTEQKRTEAELTQYREHLEELVQQRTLELVAANERTVNILESIGDGFVSYDTEWRFTYINEIAEKILCGMIGCKREDLIGRNMWEVFPAFVGTDICVEYLKAMALQTPTKFEMYREAENKWYQYSVYPGPEGMSVYFEDITERKEAEAALNQALQELDVRGEELESMNEELRVGNDELQRFNEDLEREIAERKRAEEAVAQAREEAERWSARLESFISSMADGVTLFDAYGRVITMNEVGKTMFGVPDGEEYADWSKYERYTLDGRPIPVEETASMRAVRGEVVKDFRYRLLTPWGKDAIISVSASPVLDADGRVMGATNVFRDITGQVEFENHQQNLLERERHITDMLQSVLIPDRSYDIPGCDIAVRYEPAYDEANVGGDFYDVFDLGDDKIGILLGDVAGKGLQAAMRVAAVRYSVRGYAYLDPRPSRVLAMANNALSRDSIEDAPMVTAVFAVVDKRVGVISYANGGHEPLVLRTARGEVELLNVPGRALGIMSGGEYVEDSRLLPPGDLVIVVTDGITEARGKDQQFFEIEGVAASLSDAKRPSAEKAAAKVLETAKWYAGGALRDDAAIVVFGLKKPRKR